MYSESVQQSQVRTEPAQSEQTNREREVLHSQQIRDLQQQIRDLQQQLQGQLQQQLKQQLQSSETAEFQRNLLEREKTIQGLQRQIQELQQQLRQRGDQRRGEEETSDAAASGGSIKLRWRDGGRAPCMMYGEAAAVNESVVYFLPEGYAVLAYDYATNNWSELPRCPNSDFSLAVINNLLTTIGGMTPNWECTNQLLSLTGEKWTEKFPPIPTKRWLTAVVCSGRSLVVAGGLGKGHKKLTTVEVMDTETLQWSTASSIPHTLSRTTATLCGDQVYMLGGFYEETNLPSQFSPVRWLLSSSPSLDPLEHE